MRIRSRNGLRLAASASNEKRLKGAARLRGEQWRKLVWVNIAENAEAVRSTGLRSEGET